MKKLFLVSIVLFASSLWACPNFSGEYFNENFGTYYSINQSDCETIDFQYDEGILRAPIDDQEYLVTEYDIVLEEGKIFAHVEIFSRWTFQAQKLVTKERSVVTDSRGKKEEETAWSEMFLNKQNDLVTVTHTAQGTSRIVEKRVR